MLVKLVCACKRIHIDPDLLSCTKLKSKRIYEFHIKPDTLNLIEEKVGESLEYMGKKEIFLNRTPMSYALRTRINKWDLIKLKSLFKAKDTVNRTRQQQQQIGKRSLPILYPIEG